MRRSATRIPTAILPRVWPRIVTIAVSYTTSAAVIVMTAHAGKVTESPSRSPAGATSSNVSVTGTIR